MNLGVWLVSLVQPFLARVLVSLGFSVVSIVGLDAIFTQLKTKLQTSFAALPADMLNLFLLAGGGVGLGIIFGAMTTKLILWKIQQGTKILGVNSQ
ncbi:DUF2523 family protein [Malikia sp.]|uniref:DUF2523 family protein n=1 Tax=Malikia sp. TaxID=2070706 RepID=UPI0026355B3D|nr:DUF2523 family protein [Malikia sp.]MDD2730111.1 DUF2523 family protein [Malikia sp.]